jgi:hypothetical protein
MTATKFKVEFSNLSCGWVNLRLEFGDQVLADSVSYASYSVFEDFCDFLGAAANGMEPRKITLLWEPGEYSFSIRPTGHGSFVRFNVENWPNSLRSQRHQPELVFELEARLDEIVLPFWRALRKFRTSISSERFEREWGSKFPDSEFAKLTESVNAMKMKFRDVGPL